MVDFKAASEQIGTLLDKTVPRSLNGNAVQASSVAAHLEMVGEPETERHLAEQMVLHKFFANFAGLVKLGDTIPASGADVPYREVQGRTGQFYERFSLFQSDMHGLIHDEFIRSVQETGGNQSYEVSACRFVDEAKENGLYLLVDSVWQLCRAVADNKTALGKMGNLQSGVAGELAIRLGLEQLGLTVDRADSKIDLEGGVDLIGHNPHFLIDAKALKDVGANIYVQNFRRNRWQQQALGRILGKDLKSISQIPHLEISYPSPHTVNSEAYIDEKLGIPTMAGINRLREAIIQYSNHNHGLGQIVTAFGGI